MEVQLCKICGTRHHRYEPHRFAGQPAKPPKYAKEVKYAVGLDRTVDAIIKETRRDATKAASDYSAFTDEELRACYNAVMKEVMRRRRAKK